MRKYSINTTLQLLLSILSYNCTNVRSGQPLYADTIFFKNNVTIAFHVNADTIAIPCLIETSTLLIDRAMVNDNEFKILRSDKRVDSINFMNCVNGQDKIAVKFYSVKNQILRCSVFYPSGSGRFYIGQIKLDANNNLILQIDNGKNKYSYGGPVIYGRTTYDIYIPKGYKMGDVFFKCD